MIIGSVGGGLGVVIGILEVRMSSNIIIILGTRIDTDSLSLSPSLHRLLVFSLPSSFAVASPVQGDRK